MFRAARGQDRRDGHRDPGYRRGRRVCGRGFCLGGWFPLGLCVYRCAALARGPYFLPSRSILKRHMLTSHSASESGVGSSKSVTCQTPAIMHLNNEHKIRACKAPGCLRRWKRCQVTRGCNGVYYRICKKCPDHPAAVPNR